jgi:hypothetical protein
MKKKIIHLVSIPKIKDIVFNFCEATNVYRYRLVFVNMQVINYI